MILPGRMARIALPLAICVLSCLWPPAAIGQVEDAVLTGRVLDRDGTGLPGVLLTLTNAAASIKPRSGVTNAQGFFQLDSLRAAEGYSLEVSLPDYAKMVAGPFALPAGRTTSMDLTLEPSRDLDETIYVEAQGRIVDTTSTVTSTTFNTELLEGIPLVGRRFEDVLTLAPGVTDPDGDGRPNVRGARDTGLQLRVDGTNVTDPLSGHFGQQVNLESVQEVQLITAGASAEYGRADGGFANVITKSGGNEVEGSFRYFYRSRFLDGDGAGNVEGGGGDDGSTLEFTDTEAYFTIGGPVVRDHLWYFTSVERLDHETPVVFAEGVPRLRTEKGALAFGKISWQVDQNNKLVFQVNYDPIKLGGNNIGNRISPDTDFDMRFGGPLPQLTWTSTISSHLLMQTVLSRYSGGVEISPVSDEFAPVIVDKDIQANGVTFFLLPCQVLNCRREGGQRGFMSFIREEKPPGIAGFLSGQGPQKVEGPYFFESSSDLERTTMKSDLSYFIDEHAGSHSIKAGFEFNIEKYAEEQVNTPVITDETEASLFATPAQPFRHGTLTIQAFEPPDTSSVAENLAAGAYLQESWRIRPNLTINAGLRFDQESIDTKGYTYFEPLDEFKEVLRRFDLLCDAYGSSCTTQRVPGRTNQGLTNVQEVVVPPGHPASELDLNGDGKVELVLSSPEGALVKAPLTTSADLVQEPFRVTNSNLSPRFSVSWDPFNDGKSRLFGTWGKFYDRLFLGTVTGEQEARSQSGQWNLLDGFFFDQAVPGEASLPVGEMTINQVNRDLKTPYTIEWTAGVERELGGEWAVSLTYISRRGYDLLQDFDINHITCTGFQDALGVDPYAVCGDGGQLELDRFGGIGTDIIGTVFRRPNGAVDLYAISEKFNQIMRVDNFNDSRYKAVELGLRKRLHHNWQMFLTYTYSKAEGDATSFESLQGNDPATSDQLGDSFLDFDQRHVIKWQGVTRLPHGLSLGGTLEWATGTPYTLVNNLSDRDDFDSVIPLRIYSATNQKNDQRNETQLTINGRIEKDLNLGHVLVNGFLEAENLLNNDELILESFRGSVEDRRRFGRRFQIGITARF